MTPTTLGQLITELYTYSLSIVGLCVFIMFLYAGVGLLIGRLNKDAAIKIFQDAVIGTILLYAAYIILNSINRDLVRQSTSTTTSSGSGFSAGASAGSVGGGLGISADQAPANPNPTLEPGGGSFGGGGATSSF